VVIGLIFTPILGSRQFSIFTEYIFLIAAAIFNVSRQVSYCGYRKIIMMIFPVVDAAV